MEHLQQENFSKKRTYEIAVIPGDGIGPEIIDSARSIMRQVAANYNFDVIEKQCLAGGAAIDEFGVPLPEILDLSIGGRRLLSPGGLMGCSDRTAS